MKTIWVGLLLAGVLSTPARAETVTYLHTDLLGSVVLETDQNRNVVKRYEYEPYGLPRQAIADAPGYTGHVHDAGSGLVYMQQRYYDPEVGRFLSVDPMPADTATGWNFNRYNYAANNPYTFVDPDGRVVGKPWEEPWGGDPWARIPAPLSGPGNSCPQGYLCLSEGDGGGDEQIGSPDQVQVELVAVQQAGVLLPVARFVKRLRDLLIKPRVSHSLDDLDSLRGATTKDIENLVPDHFVKSQVRRGDGVRYADPARPGDQIRIMRGDPAAPDPLHQGPYVVISRSGRVTRIPLEGNPTLR